MISELSGHNGDSGQARVRLVRIAWCIILLIGAFLRLTELGRNPLSSGEAVEAMAALEGAVGSSSGLLASANRLLFWLLGVSDGVARLAPALAGTFLPLAAGLFERRLGRYGALAAAALLALCPSAVFISRSVSPVMPGLAAALFFLGALENVRENDNRWLLAAGIAFGIGIGAGAPFLSLLAAILVAIFASRSKELLMRLGWLSRKSLLPAGIALALGSTCFLFYPEALGATADGLAFWLKGFSLDIDLMLRPIRLLVVYEPLILLLGLVGLVWMLLENNRTSGLYLVWLIAGVILAAIRPDQDDAPFLMLIPMAFLGGSVIDRLIHSVNSAENLEYRNGLPGAIAVLFILGVHIFISLGQYARFVISADANGPRNASTSLLMVGISVIMIVGIVSLVWTFSRKLALISLMAAIILFLSFYSLGKSWELGHTHQSDPRQYWVDDYAAAPGARLLVDTIETISQRTTGMRWDTPLTVLAGDPMLRWLLRDFQVTWVDALQPSISTGVVITPVGEENPILGDSYLGIDFALQHKEQTTANDRLPGNLIRWLLLRDRSNPEGVNKVVLWIRQDIALTSD